MRTAPAPAALLLAALLLSACAATTATLTPEQCRNDWRATGFQDGAEGAPQAKLDRYRAACARGGRALTAAEEAAWLDGWREAEARTERVIVVEERRGPRVYPAFGLAIGSRGVSAGGGLVFDYGSFALGFSF